MKRPVGIAVALFWAKKEDELELCEVHMTPPVGAGAQYCGAPLEFRMAGPPGFTFLIRTP